MSITKGYGKLSDWNDALKRLRAEGHLMYNTGKAGPLFYVKHYVNGVLTGTMPQDVVKVRDLTTKGDERRQAEALKNPPLECWDTWYPDRTR